MFQSHRSTRTRAALIVPFTASLLLGACAQNGLETASLGLAGQKPNTTSALAETAKIKAPDLAVKPETGRLIREARALRNAGKKAEALSLLDQAPGRDKDRALLGERGLLALETGQMDKAESLLKKAHDPKAPDWRLQSALGSALSANGKQKEAQSQFAKALSMAPDHPAILNNLALSLAMEGKHDDAERLLRQAASTAKDPQAQQNLAVVLSMRGKPAEGQAVAQATSGTAPADATAVTRADPAEALAAIKAASTNLDDGPIMQLGTH
jgi:Flp pilus assembly protein TadD